LTLALTSVGSPVVLTPDLRRNCTSLDLETQPSAQEGGLMRRVALAVVAGLAGAGVAVAMAASGPAVGAPASPLTLMASEDDKPPVVLGSGPIWGYWGKISGGDTSGSYRATCILLGAPISSARAHLPTYAGRVRATAETAEDRRVPAR